jgi:hypothetical protein
VRTAPEAFAFLRELDRSEVVQVAALGVQEFAEHALAHQHQRQHLAPVVTAVLHHHGVLLVLLLRFDHRPAVVHAVGGRHFRRHVLAGLERGQHHRHVPFPRRGCEHEVELLFTAHALEIAIALRVERRRRLAGVHHQFARALRVRGIDVADRLQLDAFERQVVLKVVRAHAAHADEADAHPIERRRRKQQRVGAPEKRGRPRPRRRSARRHRGSPQSP